MQVIIITLATVSMGDWGLRMFLRDGWRVGLKKGNMWMGIVSSIVIIICSIIILIDYNNIAPDNVLPTTKGSKTPVDWAIVRIWGFACLFKFQKPVTFTARLPEVGMTLAMCYHLIPFFSTLLGMVMIIFFMFVTVGMGMFGGHTNSTTAELYSLKLGGSSITTGYEYINFNDFPSTINMLWTNVVGNNWIFFCLMSIVSEDDSKTAYKWYFVVFQLITNMIIMNVLIGFIIDNICSAYAFIENEKKTTKTEDNPQNNNIILSLLSGNKQPNNDGAPIEMSSNAPNPFGGLGDQPESGEVLIEAEVEPEVGAEVELDVNVDAPEIEVEVDAQIDVDANVEE